MAALGMHAGVAGCAGARSAARRAVREPAEPGATTRPGGRCDDADGTFVSFTLVRLGGDEAEPCLEPRAFAAYALRARSTGATVRGRADVTGYASAACLPDDNFEIDFGEGWQPVEVYYPSQAVEVAASRGVFPIYAGVPWCASALTRPAP